MKKTVAFLFFISMILQQAVACTTFFINANGQLVFGRNYDWITDAGMVCTNLKGLYKTTLNMENGTTANWVSKYGSITFNQYGKEFPTGGMNEKGLVVELMWLEGSTYPATDNRPAVDLLQWIQYQLDNNSTIEGVIATDTKIRISLNNPPCHFLVADASGNAATIEFIDAKMIVHKGPDLPFSVLTNSTYEESVKAADSAKIPGGNTNFSFRDNSLQRFTTACSMVNRFQQNKVNKPAVDYAFDILRNVAAKDYTKWSIVYDLKNKKIYFKTARYQDIKSFSFTTFDFECSSAALVFDMNQTGKGDIRDNFEPYMDATNRRIMEKAVRESKSIVPIANELKEPAMAYAKSVHCKK